MNAEEITFIKTALKLGIENTRDRLDDLDAYESTGAVHEIAQLQNDIHCMTRAIKLLREAK